MAGVELFENNLAGKLIITGKIKSLEVEDGREINLSSTDPEEKIYLRRLFVPESGDDGIVEDGVFKANRDGVYVFVVKHGFIDGDATLEGSESKYFSVTSSLMHYRIDTVERLIDCAENGEIESVLGEELMRSVDGPAWIVEIHNQACFRDKITSINTFTDVVYMKKGDRVESLCMVKTDKGEVKFPKFCKRGEFKIFFNEVPKGEN